MKPEPLGMFNILVWVLNCQDLNLGARVGPPPLPSTPTSSTACTLMCPANHLALSSPRSCPFVSFPDVENVHAKTPPTNERNSFRQFQPKQLSRLCWALGAWHGQGVASLLPGAGLFAARALSEAGQRPKEYTAEELAQVRICTRCSCFRIAAAAAAAAASRKQAERFEAAPPRSGGKRRLGRVVSPPFPRRRRLRSTHARSQAVRACVSINHSTDSSHGLHGGKTTRTRTPHPPRAHRCCGRSPLLWETPILPLRSWPASSAPCPRGSSRRGRVG